MLAGVSLWVLGYIGVFFGRLIKAAVSRQREFLADASAVQFTRNRDGIGGALRKIGGLGSHTGLGTRIEHPQAEALSHLFLGAARPSFVRGMFATHPPLEERVQRIYGRRMDFMPAPENPLALAMGGLEASEPEGPRSPIRFVPSDRVAAPSVEQAAAPFPDGLSPVAGIVAAGAAAAAELTHTAGTMRPPRPRPDFALDDAQRATLAELRRAAADATQTQLLVAAMLTDTETALQAQQRQIIAEAHGGEGAQIADQLHRRIQQLPPGARHPLIDVAMPALRKLPAATRASLLKLAHMLVIADGRLTVPEFLLYTILKRRLGPDAGRAVPVKFQSLDALLDEAGLLLSLVAVVRLPGRPEHAYNAGALLLPAETRLITPGAIRLDAVADALDRLNQLAPLAKPQLIKAATAVAFVDGDTNWSAASCLRMICAAIDVPLPPQVIEAEA
jgi:hypothetical protein